jgi:hypothetical protein
LSNKGIAVIVKQSTYLGSKTALLVETETGETLKLWTNVPALVGGSFFFEVTPESLIRL